MNTKISSDSPKVFFSNGRLVTTSQAVADYFDKQHKNVLQKIDTLDCSPEFASANFSAHAENQVVGIAEREIRYYEITKDGFMFLVMGFTGKRAARLKEAYIAKFNFMEEELHRRDNAVAMPTSPLYEVVDMLVEKVGTEDAIEYIHSLMIDSRPSLSDFSFLTTIKNGQVSKMRPVLKGEHLMTFDTFKEIAERAGYLVIHSDNLRNMTLDKLMVMGQKKPAALPIEF